MQPLSQVSEREERESSTREYGPFKVPRGTLQHRVWSIIYSPFPLLAVMGKTRTSRTVRDALADCPRLNSNSKNAKSTAGRTDRWAGRTVRQDPADRPPGPRGSSAWDLRTVRGQAEDRPPGPLSRTLFC
jgi:hypothetical protein